MHVKGVIFFFLSTMTDGPKLFFTFKQVTFSYLTRVHPSRKLLLPTCSHLWLRRCWGAQLLLCGYCRRGWSVIFYCPQNQTSYIHVHTLLFTAECVLYLGKLMAGCCGEPCKPLENDWTSTSTICTHSPTQMSGCCTNFSVCIVVGDGAERSSKCSVLFSSCSAFGFHLVFIHRATDEWEWGWNKDFFFPPEETLLSSYWGECEMGRRVSFIKVT